MSGMKLPKAVLDAKEKSDKAMKIWKEAREGNPDPDAPDGDGAPDTGGADEGATELGAAAEPAIPAGEDEGGKPKDEFAVNWEAEAKAMKEERDKAVTSFQTLQGKYNAEVPRLSDELRTLKDKVKTLETAAPAAEPATPVVSAELDEKIGKLKEMYGDGIEDVINIAISKATGEAVEKATAATRAEFEPRLKNVDNIETRAAEDSQDTMFDAVSEKHADWRKVNAMATFHRFLAEVFPGTRLTRQEIIDEAVEANDPKPIIHQLTAFKRRSKRGNAALENQAVPGDEGKAPVLTEGDTKVYALQAVKDHQMLMARLASRNTPPTDEQKHLDATYEMALREGRVR